MPPARCGVLLAAALLAGACSGGGEARPPDGAASAGTAPPTTVVATSAATTTTLATGTTLPAMAPVPGAALGAPFGALALYQPPSTLEGLPGDVVWAAPRPAPAGARAWTVLYLTQDDDGLLAPVSGVVLAPEGPAPPGGRPIVTWAHGTVGSADTCAPSRHGDLGIPALEELLDEGYVVAATDYPGLGTPGAQHYLDGGSQGRSVLDAARAAMRLTQGGPGPTSSSGATPRAATRRCSRRSSPRCTPPTCASGASRWRPP